MNKCLAIASTLLLWASIGQAKTLTAAQAKIHVGENATVCGTISDRHIATHSQGIPTFIDLEKPYPNQPFTVVVWARDKATIGTLPSTGQFCVTGQISLYHGGAQIVLHSAASWYVPKLQSVPPPPQLSNDNHYTNSDGQQVHSLHIRLVTFQQAQPLYAVTGRTVLVSIEAALAPIMGALRDGSDGCCGGLSRT